MSLYCTTRDLPRDHLAHSDIHECSHNPNNSRSGRNQETRNKKATTQNLQLLSSRAAEDEEPPGSSAHLGDSAEVEDTLVFEAGQVGEDVRDVVEGIGDELIEALHGHVDVLWLGKV